MEDLWLQGAYVDTDCLPAEVLFQDQCCANDHEDMQLGCRASTPQMDNWHQHHQHNAHIPVVQRATCNGYSQKIVLLDFVRPRDHLEREKAET